MRTAAVFLDQPQQPQLSGLRNFLKVHVLRCVAAQRTALLQARCPCAALAQKVPGTLTSFQLSFYFADPDFDRTHEQSFFSRHRCDSRLIFHAF